MATSLRNAWRDARTSTRLAPLEIVVAALLIVLIQASVFHGYYSGSASPGGDFLGGYSNEPFAWWRDGGILSPPDWMPYLWGGYPAVASIQNSAWYLPTGLATLFGFDIHASACLQAIHVAVAGLGVYVLGRRANLGRVASAFGLVAYSFTTGFYSNSPYVDMVRGHALAPWILLCLSPLWPWKRAWAIPVATLILWQATVGVYPGMLVAFLYAGGAWAVAWQLAKRPNARQFALPALSAGVFAVLLSLPKYLPLIVLKTFQPGDVPDLTGLARSSLGAFLLPTFSGLPGTYTLNSFFIPAAAVLLAALASFRSVIVRASLAAAVVAVVMAVPQIPGHALLSALPGVGSSRFPINDFRPFVILPVVIAGMSGLARLRRKDFVEMGRRGLWVRLALVLLVPVAAGLFVVVGRFNEADWVPVGVVLGLTALVVVSLTTLASTGRLQGAARFAAPALLIGLTAASGFAYVRTEEGTWSIDTIAKQEALWGARSSELIEHRVDLSGTGQRPARSVIPEAAMSPGFDNTALNSSFYTGVLSTGGYMNVHMSYSFLVASRALADTTTADAERALLGAPGIIIGSTGSLPSAGKVNSCVHTRLCNGVVVEPVSYAPGDLVYDVTAKSPTTVLVNEAYYVGWAALALDEHGRASALEPRQGPGGVIALDLPDGSWRLSLIYRTPLGGVARVLATIGLALVGFAGIAPVVRRRRSRTRTASHPRTTIDGPLPAF